MHDEVKKYIREQARLGGHARAAKLGKKGLSDAMRKAVNARWAKYRKEKGATR